MIHKEAQKYIVVKKQYFYNRLICKKKQLFYIKKPLFYKNIFLQPFNL